MIRGYHAAVDTSQLGLPIEALIHFRADGLNSFRVKEQLESMAEVIDAWSVTGDDCLILHIVMPSVAAIEEFLLRLRHHGSTSTAIVLSTPITRRTIRRQRLLPAKFQNSQ